MIGIVIFLFGIFLWKKSNHPEFFWSLFPVGGVIMISILEHLSEAFSWLNDDQKVAEYYVSFTLRVIAFIAFFAITIRYLKKQGNGKQKREENGDTTRKQNWG
jgi:pilus assembly protein TadC